MSELSERFCLDLADTLTGNVEFLAHFFKSAASSVLKTEAEFEYLCLSGSQG